MKISYLLNRVIRSALKYLLLYCKNALLRCFIWLQNQDAKHYPVDLTLIGIVKYADGIGRIPIGITELLHADLTIKCLPTNIFTVKHHSQQMQKVSSSRRLMGSKVCIVSEQIYTTSSRPYLLLPPSTINISYSMIESTRIPTKWSDILNSRFDLIAVPDPSLVEVYQHSGVKIPIFELPLGIELTPFFAMKKEKKTNIPFVFGTTVSCDPRKNIPLLIKAFYAEFGADQDIVLRINSRFGDHKSCQALIDSLNTQNILFTQKTLDQEQYVRLMSTFDCFVNISMGEGFSICPREALALGIPCILSNHTAHTTLCDTGFVRSVPCPIQQPAFEPIYGKEQLGYFHTCAIEEVQSALRDMYEQYSDYLEKATQAKSWVRKYQWENLKDKYLNLIKPKRVVLGEQNCLRDDCLITNSLAVYNKYLKL